jgi:hypothetical protein
MKTTANYQKLFLSSPLALTEKNNFTLQGKEITGHYTQMPTVDLYKSGERGFKKRWEFYL